MTEGGSDPDARKSVEVPFALPWTGEVELPLSATVTLTQELCDGIADQYPDFWSTARTDPEELARAVLYALVNPRLPYRADGHDYWDGVVCLDGLVETVEIGR